MSLDSIYISSLAFQGKSPEEIIEHALKNDLAIEFSSGMKFTENLENIFLEAPVIRMAHNYFPAPQHPFVLNLASSNDEIRTRSINHCLHGLEISKRVNAPFFAAHAGFCVDPMPDELGNKIIFKPEINYESCRSFFLNSLKQILQEAERLKIDFLIENNVISPVNFIDGLNPLLCCTSADIKYVFENINSPRLGLLLDTAHLKVSCKTIGLDMITELNEIGRFIKGIHHSDNNGLIDNNMSIKNDYWFLPFLKQYTNNIHVLEVKDLSQEEINIQIKLLQQNGN